MTLPTTDPLPTFGEPDGRPFLIDVEDRDVLNLALDADMGERLVKRTRGRATSTAHTMSTDEVMELTRGE